MFQCYNPNNKRNRLFIGKITLYHGGHYIMSIRAPDSDTAESYLYNHFSANQPAQVNLISKIECWEPEYISRRNNY